MKKLGLTLTVLFLVAIFSNQSSAKEDYWQLANTCEQKANAYLQQGEKQAFIDSKTEEMNYNS